MPFSRVRSENVFGTRASTSAATVPREARIGIAIVESSGGIGGPCSSVTTAGGAAGREQAANKASEIDVIIFRTVMSDATTRGIRVEVESEYLADKSNPHENEYFFAYRVRISNVGGEAAQLVSREWIITDGEGRVERVKGAGVVGEFPRLEPGESYEYTSFCPLTTSVGSMHGSYTMRTRSGETFDAAIAPFTLAVPGVIN
jgi:ApaG protein